MLTEDGKHLYVSYVEYHNLIEKLAIKVHQSGWEFDTILCLARGGMRPGDILSRIFEKPLAIMSTSSYRAKAGTEQGHLDIAKYITTPQGEIAGRVLLVDDLADSGHTLDAVMAQLRAKYPAITELRSAVHLDQGTVHLQGRLLGRVPADQSLDPPALRRLRPHAAGRAAGQVEGLKKAHPQAARTSCRYATPLAGGNASGPAEPVPRRSPL